MQWNSEPSFHSSIINIYKYSFVIVSFLKVLIISNFSLITYHMYLHVYFIVFETFQFFYILSNMIFLSIIKCVFFFLYKNSNHYSNKAPLGRYKSLVRVRGVPNASFLMESLLFYPLTFCLASECLNGKVLSETNSFYLSNEL